MWHAVCYMLHVVRCKWHQRRLHVAHCPLHVVHPPLHYARYTLHQRPLHVASVSVACSASYVARPTLHYRCMLHQRYARYMLHQRPLLLHQCALHGARCPLSVCCTLHQCPLHVASVACRIGSVRCMLHRRWCGMHGACLCLECRCSTAPMSCLNRCCHATRQHLRRAQIEYAEYPQHR